MGRRLVRPAIVVALAGAAVFAALAAGAFAGAPDWMRVVLAFLALVMWPGAAVVFAGAKPPGGWALAAGWALGFGVAWNAILILATRAFGLPFTLLGVVALPLGLVVWGVMLVVARRRPAVAAGSPLSSTAAAAILLAALLAGIHAGRVGAPLGYFNDSPDHIGTVRRMMTTGDAFPRDAYFPDPGRLGADPRKGLWHPQVALISKLARLDPVDTWKLLPSCTAFLLVLNAAVLGFLVRGSGGAAVTAWAMLLTYGGTIAGQGLRETAHSTKLGDQLALAAAVAVLADLASPGRRFRLSAVALAVAAVSSHVYYALQFALVFPALGLAMALRTPEQRAALGRMTGTVLAMAVACVPIVAVRVLQTSGPHNLLHTEPQGLLWITDGVKVVTVGVLWTWLGTLWPLVPAAWPWLWRDGARSPAVLYLLTTSLAAALVIFNPLAVAVLEPRMGYLLMRTIWMVPLAGILGWALTGLWAHLSRGPFRARLRAAAAAAAIAVLTAPAVVDARLALLDARRLLPEDEPRSTLPWRDALEWMRNHLPPGSVVLADPATSYAIPMYTGLYVTTMLDQHGSPNDTLALRRILDARDALDPYGSWDRMREVVDRYGVSFVALNNRFTEPPPLDYWAPRPEWFTAARARLEDAPSAFDRIFDRGDFAVYRVDRAALDSLDGPPRPRPFVRPFVPGRSPVGRRMGDGLPALHLLRLSSPIASPGDTLWGVADWRALESLPPRSYRVALRIAAPLPGGFEPPRWIGKPARKLVERLRGVRYRFRADHLPVSGSYGVDLWGPDQLVRDSFPVVVPGDMAEGTYRIRIKMLAEPHYPNYRLSDYFFDDDYYSGLEWSFLEIRTHADGAPDSGRPGARDVRPVHGGR